MSESVEVFWELNKITKFSGLPIFSIPAFPFEKKIMHRNILVNSIVLCFKICCVIYIFIKVIDNIQSSVLFSDGQNTIKMFLYFATDVAWILPTVFIDLVMYFNSTKTESIINDLIFLKLSLKVKSNHFANKCGQLYVKYKCCLCVIIVYEIFLVIFDIGKMYIISSDELSIQVVVIYQTYLSASNVIFSFTILQCYIVLSDIKLIYTTCSKMLNENIKFFSTDVVDIYIKVTNLSLRCDSYLGLINLSCSLLLFSQYTLFAFKMLLITASTQKLEFYIHILSHAFWMIPNSLPILIFYQCDNVNQEVILT